MGERINVIIADDHSVVRCGLKQIVESDPSLRLQGMAACAKDLYVLLQTPGLQARILLLDISLPDAFGLETLVRVKREYPALSVIIVSMHPESRYGIRALRSGAAGYIMKSRESEEIIAAIHKVAAGGIYISAELAEDMAMSIMQNKAVPDIKNLSERELQVFHLLASGEPIKSIALTLGVHENTVSTYKRRMLEKLQLSSTVDLIKFALMSGLAE